MKKVLKIGGALTAIAIGFALTHATDCTANERPPNIVFILADDLGIMDVCSYAAHLSETKPENLFYETPHIDDLVRKGIAFSQAYANQLCSPTRAAILTGQYASRLGVTTATPRTRTYYNQAIEPPHGYSPHDAFAHKDAINRQLAWGNAHSKTAVEYTSPPATDNYPFKGGKACLYEGGVRVPLVVYQPAKYDQGIWCDAPVNCIDFLPTIAAMTGNSIPDGVDGQSLLDLLEHPDVQTPTRTFYWHYPFNVIVKHPDNGFPLTPHSAIRVGDHKLIWDWHGKLELYDIPADPYEQNDLSRTKPKLSQQLFKRLKSWLRKNVKPQYFPVSNPAYEPAQDERGPMVNLWN